MQLIRACPQQIGTFFPFWLETKRKQLQKRKRETRPAHKTDSSIGLECGRTAKHIYLPPGNWSLPREPRVISRWAISNSPRGRRLRLHPQPRSKPKQGQIVKPTCRVQTRFHRKVTPGTGRRAGPRRRFLCGRQRPRRGLTIRRSPLRFKGALIDRLPFQRFDFALLCVRSHSDHYCFAE